MNPFNTTIPKLEAVSDKYKFIPTIQVVEDLQSLGFTSIAKHSPRRGLGLHCVDFSHPSLNRPELEGIGIRLRMYNAHDASAAFQFRLTLLNGVCLNILEPEESKELATLNARIVHRGYALEKVKVALSNLETYVDAVTARVQRLQATQVDTVTLMDFVLKARELRDAQPIQALMLAKVRHLPQAENNAWNVFNRVQEALIRGGYITQNAEGHRSTARGLTNVREVAMLNRKLWKLAEDTLLTPMRKVA